MIVAIFARLTWALVFSVYFAAVEVDVANVDDQTARSLRRHEHSVQLIAQLLAQGFGGLLAIGGALVGSRSVGLCLGCIGFGASTVCIGTGFGGSSAFQRRPVRWQQLSERAAASCLRTLLGFLLLSAAFIRLLMQRRDASVFCALRGPHARR